MTTALEIITGALEEIGVAEVGQAVEAEDAALCLRALNTLADAHLTEPLYAYATTTVSASLPAGTMSRTIGASQQFNCSRPVRLEPGCFVSVGGVDYPLSIIGEAEYNGISQKNIAGPWPSVVMYDAGSPTGNVYFWPTGACTVNLMVQTQASQFADMSTDYTLPPGYKRLFKFCLAEEVASTYQRQVSALTARNAAQARLAVKRANFVVPQLESRLPVVGIPPIY